MAIALAIAACLAAAAPAVSTGHAGHEQPTHLSRAGRAVAETGLVWEARPLSRAPGHAEVWTTISPVYLGAHYRPGGGALRPFAAAELAAAPVFVSEVLAPTWAPGCRGRLGVDLAAAKNVHLRFDAGASWWSGKEGAVLPLGEQPMGPVPYMNVVLNLTF